MRGLNALQLALGSVGAGISGYQTAQARREQEERLRREEARQAEMDRRMLERQTVQDAAALRREEREAIGAGMIPSEKFAAMTMPGATPMKPAISQKIGDREFVYSPEVSAAEKHRADVMKGRKELSQQRGTQSSVAAALAEVESGGKRLSQKQIDTWSKLDRQERTSLVNNWVEANKPKTARGDGGASTKGMPSPEDLARAEGVWNSLTNVPDNQLSPEEVQFRNTMVNTFDKLRANKRTAPAPSLIFQAVSAAEAQNKRLTAPPKPPGGEGSDYERRKREILEGKSGQTAPTAPAATPAAPTAAAPNAALEQDRKLWDEAVAKYGRERVIAEYGPRP